MKIDRLITAAIFAVAFLLVGPSLYSNGLQSVEAGSKKAEANFEVWAIDQSNSRPNDVGDLTSGGILHIYDGAHMSGNNAANAVPEVIDLGGAASDLCLSQTGTLPVRPHMIFFNTDKTHAVISFVASGHILFIDAASRTSVGCVDVGVQAHAAVPTPDQTAVIVANQNGKLLQRISTDYSTNTFTLDNLATLDLANGTTPSGALRQDPALRPDNAPICPLVDTTGNVAFVTLRGGGLFVVDIATSPMSIIAEYDKSVIHPNGCGGAEAAGKIYVNSGGGTAGNLNESDLYAFKTSDFISAESPFAPNMPVPTLVFSNDDRGDVDSHGTVLTKHGKYLWVNDRAANIITVVDTVEDKVVNEFRLGSDTDDPTPDLMDISPSGNRIFVTFRGPNPLSGDPHVSTGNTPGVGVIKVTEGGKSGELKAVASITHVVDGVERADPHGIRVRALSN